ncbi:hypothetical protein SLEP1_g34138 [Rubroshorea leprosula]|uniref:Uncharacterized protein n=1 Tax=Rubroshorea leprosula TaxID=152421 RepID=A0AAV5KIV1_9ROSI|nr:hypothetical protein SLEP1_g34138 [Rubroshorea leprosula]
MTFSFNSQSTEVALNPEELTKINLLIPRLCLSNHLKIAIQLTTTALNGKHLFQVCGVLVGGLCGAGLVLEGLRVLRDMVKENLRPGEGLREARIWEAMELKDALIHVGDGERQAFDNSM